MFDKAIYKMSSLVGMLFAARIPFQVCTEDCGPDFPMLYYPNGDADECIITVACHTYNDDGCPVENGLLKFFVDTECLFGDINQEPINKLDLTVEEAFERIYADWKERKKIWEH